MADDVVLRPDKARPLKVSVQQSRERKLDTATLPGSVLAVTVGGIVEVPYRVRRSEPPHVWLESPAQAMEQSAAKKGTDPALRALPQ